jgi:hypothetical protein
LVQCSASSLKDLLKQIKKKVQALILELDTITNVELDKLSTLIKNILNDQGIFWLIVKTEPEGNPILSEQAIISLIQDGWILRNQIIVCHEALENYAKIYFLVKQPRYVFKQQLEPYTKPLNRWGGEVLKPKQKESSWDKATGQKTYRKRKLRPNPDGRNLRCVWFKTLDEAIDTILKASSVASDDDYLLIRVT